MFNSTTVSFLSWNGVRYGRQDERNYPPKIIFLNFIITSTARGNVTIFFRHVVLLDSPRRYPYFDVVVGLVWSHDPKTYAGGRIC
jgi:hypothetical protein